MDIPEKRGDDIQLVPISTETEGNEISNAANESIEPVSNSEIEGEQSVSLIHEKKEKMEYKEIGSEDDEVEDEQLNEGVICDMLKTNSDKLIPMFKDTLLTQHRFTNKNTILHLGARYAGGEMMENILDNRGDLQFDEKNCEDYNILNTAVENNNEESLMVILKWIKKLKEENDSISEMLDGECGRALNTPLHQAYNNKNYKIMFELVKAGADPSCTDNYVYSTLHYAALDNNIEAVQAVVDGAREGGKDAEEKLQEARETTDFKGFLPAMDSDHEEIIKLLLYGVNLSNESCHEDYGSMLHFACDQNRPYLAKYLIANEVPLNTENPFGFTPLCIVAQRGYEQIGTALLEAKADPNLLLTETQLSPLNYAAQHGRAGIVRELVKYGANTHRTDAAKSVLYSAVFGGNYDVNKFLLEECKCNANAYDRLGDRKKKPLCVAIEKGHISLIKLLLQHGISAVETVDSHENHRPIHIAILSKQRQALQILLEHGANPDDKTASGATPAQLAVDNDASTLLPLLISYGISFTKRDVYGNTLLHTIARDGAVRCAEVLLSYLTENYLDQIERLLLEEKDSRGRTPVDRAVQEGNEAVLIQFFGHINCDYFIQHPTIYHQLVTNNLFEALKALMDESVHEKYLDVTLEPKYLDSVNSLEHPYPDDPQYDRFEPSFLHKLLYCPDPLVKYHPLVSIVVREKLRFYRWWYVFTFFLYCIFLSCLYYALIQASYLCDDTLLSYNDASSKGRAFCEVIVVIYGFFFIFDEFLEFILQWYQTHKEMKLVEAADEEREHGAAGEGKGVLYTVRKIFRISKILRAVDRFLVHFFSTFFVYIGVLNLIDISALISLIFLIILRLSQVPGQWTFASFTFILFSLKLFKYTRIFPSLGAYVRTIVHIFIYDITQFGIIIFIFLLAYFGGIHLAARQNIVERGTDSSLPNEQTCSNQSISSLFWLDQDRTLIYDLRRPLITGVIFLLDGGPGNEESTLLNSNVLFTLLYLTFAFTIIVVMLNILIAQLSETYAQVIKTSGFHYKIELVVTIEFRSNLAFFIGRTLRMSTSIEELTLEPAKWHALKESSPRKDTDLQIEENHSRLKRNVKLLEDEKLRGTIGHEWVQDKITVLGQNIEKTLNQNTTLETRIDKLEDKLEQILNLLQPKT